MTNDSARTMSDEAMVRAALLDLAKDVPGEMAAAFSDAFENPELPGETTHEEALRIGLAAAIRAITKEQQDADSD